MLRETENLKGPERVQHEKVVVVVAGALGSMFGGGSSIHTPDQVDKMFHSRDGRGT